MSDGAGDVPPADQGDDSAPGGDTPAEQPLIAQVVADNADETVMRLAATEKSYREDPARKKKEDEWRTAGYAYGGYKVPGQAWCIREIFRQVETLIPKLAKAILGGDEMFRLTARVDGFEEATEAAAAIIHDQWRRFGSIKQLHLFVRDFVIYGTAYLLPSWRRFARTAHVPKRKPMHAPSEDDEWERETNEVIVDAPFLEYIAPWECYQPPMTEDAKNSDAFFIVRHISVEDGKTLVREGELDGDAFEEAIKEGTGSVREDGQFAPIKNRLMVGRETTPTYKLSLCWTADGWHYRTLNDKTLLFAQQTDDGKIPIIQASNYGQSREAWGTGEPNTILDDQRLLNEMTQLWVNQQWYGLPMWIVKEGAYQQFSRTTFKPGGAMRGDPADVGLMPQSERSATMDLASSMSFVIERQKLTSGLSNEVAGSKGDTGTATGINLLQGAAGDRIQYKLATWLIPAIAEAVAATYNLNAKYLNTRYAIRITGSDGVSQAKQYGPDVFAPDVDVEIDVGTNNSDGGNTAMNAYKIYGQDPLVNRSELIKEGIKALNWARPKRFMANPANAQADALEEGVVLAATGIINDPKPNEDSMTHLQIHTMQLQSPPIAADPILAARMQNHLALTQLVVNQIQAAQAQQQQASLLQQGGGQGPGGGATAIQKQANDRANGKFGMGAMGALGKK